MDFDAEVLLLYDDGRLSDWISAAEQSSVLSIQTLRLGPTRVREHVAQHYAAAMAAEVAVQHGRCSSSCCSYGLDAHLRAHESKLARIAEGLLPLEQETQSTATVLDLPRDRAHISSVRASELASDSELEPEPEPEPDPGPVLSAKDLARIQQAEAWCVHYLN